MLYFTKSTFSFYLLFTPQAQACTFILFFRHKSVSYFYFPRLIFFPLIVDYNVRLCKAAKQAEREWGAHSLSRYSTLKLPSNVTKTTWAMDDLPPLGSTAHIDAALDKWLHTNLPPRTALECEWYPIIETLVYTLCIPQGLITTAGGKFGDRKIPDLILVAPENERARGQKKAWESQPKVAPQVPGLQMQKKPRIHERALASKERHQTKKERPTFCAPEHVLQTTTGCHRLE